MDWSFTPYRQYFSHVTAAIPMYKSWGKNYLPHLWLTLRLVQWPGTSTSGSRTFAVSFDDLGLLGLYTYMWLSDFEFPIFRIKHTNCATTAVTREEIMDFHNLIIRTRTSARRVMIFLKNVSPFFIDTIYLYIVCLIHAEMSEMILLKRLDGGI